MKKMLTLAFALCSCTIMLNAQNHGNSHAAKEKKGKKSKTETKANAKATTNSYGAAITKDGAVDVKTLPAKMKGQKSMAVKISGDIVAACKVKGCWMTADLGNGETMRIRFKDYGFFVPKDAGGDFFYAQGVASWDTTSVAQLQHYAEDAGKSEAEIAKITEPKIELVFLAEGVLIEPRKK